MRRFVLAFTLLAGFGGAAVGVRLMITPAAACPDQDRDSATQGADQGK
jgi:hypothetical protein